MRHYDGTARQQQYTPKQAEERVGRLREAGIWPGMITVPGGLVRLTFDPPWPAGLLDSHGYLRDPGAAR